MINTQLTTELLNQLYTAAKDQDSERTSAAVDTLLTLGVSYRVCNRVLMLAHSSNCIEDICSTIKQILNTEGLQAFNLPALN